MVVQREDRIDVLPWALLGSNASSTIILGQSQEKVDYSQALGLANGLIFKDLVDVLLGSSNADTIEPILDSLFIYFGFEVLVGRNLDKNEDRGIVDTAANFRGDTGFRENFNQLCEACFGLVLLYDRLVVLC